MHRGVVPPLSGPPSLPVGCTRPDCRARVPCRLRPVLMLRSGPPEHFPDQFRRRLGGFDARRGPFPDIWAGSGLATSGEMGTRRGGSQTRHSPRLLWARVWDPRRRALGSQTGSGRPEMRQHRSGSPDQKILGPQPRERIGTNISGSPDRKPDTSGCRDPGHPDASIRTGLRSPSRSRYPVPTTLHASTAL